MCLSPLALYFVGTRTYHFSRNGLLLFVSVAYLFVAILDTAHTLSYKGMNLIPNATTNAATQLWIAARILGISTLFMATFVGYRELSTLRLHLIFGAITVAMLASIIIGVFPRLLCRKYRHYPLQESNGISDYHPRCISVF